MTLCGDVIVKYLKFLNLKPIWCEIDTKVDSRYISVIHQKFSKTIFEFFI